MDVDHFDGNAGLSGIPPRAHGSLRSDLVDIDVRENYPPLDAMRVNQTKKVVTVERKSKHCDIQFQSQSLHSLCRSLHDFLSCFR